MKRLSLLVSVFVIALMVFAAVASAQQASVFGDNVLVRAYLVQCIGDACADPNKPTYSAYLEVRDYTGTILPVEDFTVTGVSPTVTPADVTVNPFRIHNNDLVNNDISISYDSVNKTLYVFCTDGTAVAPNLHVMTYDISPNTPVNAACVTYSQGLTQAPINLCAAGTASAVSGTGPWSWTCYGANGGQNASCSAYKKVDGVCGSSNLQTFTSVPTTNLCSAGTESSVSGNGPWSWTCTGSYGGLTASCSANIQSTGTADLAFTTSYGYVTGIQGPKAGYNNIPFYENVTIVNYGTGDAGSFTVKMWLTQLEPTAIISTNCNLDPNAILLYTWNVSGLGAGQSKTAKLDNLLVSGQSIHTAYYICVKVDADNQIAETKETNNAYTFGFGFYR